MLRKSLFYYLILTSLLLPSCEFRCTVGDSDKKDDSKKAYKPVQKDGALLYNGIHLVTRGVQVEKAYLVTDDEQADRIGEDNFIDFKRGVKMVLHIKQGWKEVVEKVRIGASMLAVLENGSVLTEEQDLFREYDEKGIAAGDSKIISLTLFYKEGDNSRPVSIKVSFKVWDKQGDAFVEGDYTVHTR